MWPLSQNTLLYCTPPSSGDDVDDNLLDDEVRGMT